ncbi:hypothetical protein IAD21_05452 [Abditibacteriota bacterium]|nr:hypothetical protein IAD21_05452 [Abditibacteriota bacterium]
MTFGGNRAVDIEEALELLFEVFDGARAQFVKEGTHRLGVEGVLGMWISPVTRRDEGLPT